MKILLLSDTHGYLDSTILKYVNKCDVIWHAGDIGHINIISDLSSLKPLKAVFGNIDGSDIRMLCPENQDFFCEGLRVWITHIGGKPPTYTSVVATKIKKEPIDLFICGHSHILKIMHDHHNRKMLYLNPGAAGKYGIHCMRTMVMLTIEKKIVKDLQVIELGKK